MRQFGDMADMCAAPPGSNAYAVLELQSDHIIVDGCGTCVTSRTLALSAPPALGFEVSAGGSQEAML